MTEISFQDLQSIYVWKKRKTLEIRSAKVYIFGVNQSRIL